MGKTCSSSKIFTGCLCAVICEIIYGFSYIFTKHVTDSVSELALLGWRFLLGAAVMTLLVLLNIIKVNFRGRSLFPLLRIAILCPCLYFIGETFGISMTTASESGAMIAAIPVISLIMSSLILKKKPGRLQIAGISITLFGVLATVFAAGISASFSLPGYIILSAGVVTYSLYSIYVEKAESYTGSEITYFMLITGAAFFTILAVIEAVSTGTVSELTRLPFENTDFLIAILYQGIGCSIIAFYLSNISIAYIGVNRNASFMGIATLVSILAGILVLGERVTLIQGIGACLILLGVYTANLRQKKTSPPSVQ